MNTDIVNQAADVVRLFEVGLDTQITDQADGEGFVGDTHLEEIGLGEVGTELGFDGVFFGECGRQQHIGGDVAVEESILSCDRSVTAPVADRCLRTHVVQVPAAVLQLVKGRIGCQTRAVGEDVCAITLGGDIGR